MAIVHPLTIRQQVFAQKLETTTGTPIALGAADGVLNIFDPIIKPIIAPRDRQGQGSFSPLAVIPGARAAEVSYKYELHGAGASGGASTEQGKILKASGFTVSSNTYTVASGSTALETLTCGHYIDGRLLQAAGVMFNLKLSGQTGEPVMVEATGRGKWVAPTATALITPTYLTTIAPVLVSSTFTIGGTSYTIPGFELDLGNNVVLRNDITDSTGIRAAYITNRQVKFSISPESLALGTKDWWADHMARTTGALVLTVGSASGNTISITAPALQLYQPPEIEDRDGVQADKLEFISVRSASAGDDDLVVTFS